MTDKEPSGADRSTQEPSGKCCFHPHPFSKKMEVGCVFSLSANIGENGMYSCGYDRLVSFLHSFCPREVKEAS